MQALFLKKSLKPLSLRWRLGVIWKLEKLDKQTEVITEYLDTLVRRLIEKITVYDEALVVKFKSGLEITVDA